MEVDYVEWGIANNFNDYIEVNKHLKEYPKLHDAILKHEKKHTDSVFSKKDFILDWNQDVSNWELFKFILNHPKALAQLSPIYFSRKKAYYDLNMIIVYSIIIIAILVGLFIL